MWHEMHLRWPPSDEVEMSELDHVGFVGWNGKGEDEHCGFKVSELAVDPFEAGVSAIHFIEVMDAAFDGTADVGCHGCVDGR